MVIKKNDEEEVQEEKSSTESKEYNLVEVPASFGLAIQKPDGETITQEQAIVEILNIVKDIKKAVN